MLKFSPGSGNAKLQSLGGKVYTFSLPSGWSCPGADDCYSRAVSKDGKVAIVDGPNTKFRCFSASQEVVYTAVRQQRQYNFDLIKTTLKEGKVKALGALIQGSLPKDATVIRIHVAGDFFSKAYLQAWIAVAVANPNIIFYAYTKSLHYWVECIDFIPNNFKLNASKGGKFDHLIDAYHLKYAEVVFTEQEALEKGLEIDHDDSHAFLKDNSFALLLHGVQPKGSEAAEALKLLKKAGIGQYSKTKTNGTTIKKESKVLSSTEV